MREGLFTKDAPFKTVEEYTEWWLSKNGHFDLTESGMHLNELLYQHHVKTISLDRIKNKAVDIISVVDSEINEDWWETTTDTDQFLVAGTVREINEETTLYLQGYGWAERAEGKLIRKQDAWLDSLD